MVHITLHIFLAFCDYSDCVILDEPFPSVYWHTHGVDRFVLDAMGGAEAALLGAFEYEDHSPYREYTTG